MDLNSKRIKQINTVIYDNLGKITITLNDISRIQEPISNRLRDNTAGENCFFKAVSICMYRNDSEYQNIREGACRYIRENPDTFAGSFISIEQRNYLNELRRLELPMTDQEKKYNREMKTLEEYVLNMKVQEIWAEGAVIDATALLLKRRLYVHITGQDILSINQDARLSIHLLFVGQNHYMSMFEQK
ncbi:MAG: hypothetical protein EZS28_042554 [Streblomastix strix]|uniref:OTU domain-containing protein n=1 Tax=Streblomastix strix TaxID=222440 RepID=A0A5J4TV66_9EUKA|nr:MAG: hypothetical protein EZS28_042554 [Streblomastix strix]